MMNKQIFWEKPINTNSITDKIHAIRSWEQQKEFAIEKYRKRDIELQSIIKDPTLTKNELEQAKNYLERNNKLIEDGNKLLEEAATHRNALEACVLSMSR